MSEKNNIWKSPYSETLIGHIKFELKSMLGRAFKSQPPRLKLENDYLHLGCGLSYYDSFINADFFSNFKFWVKSAQRVDWELDFRFVLKCPTDSWDGVYTEHVLEHLTHQEVLHLLKELHRTMKDGAILRIIVPDVEQCCIDYHESIGLPNPENGARLIWDLTQNWGHKSVWDYALMHEALTAAGFSKIKKSRFGEGENPFLLKDSEHRQTRSLYVEAKK
ncbi:hypothetical protein N9M89_02725 [Amylibacter sp.]|jgi:predicted SAM-dependent methyltransferase|nr:hypothetical protein [Amylibacter sp.]